MILKSYLFCFKQNNYVQYPNDHTASFLKPLCGNHKEKHQVVVYRDGGLMYYCYLYDAGENETIGFCFATGLLCTQMKRLYDTFINCIVLFARRGIIFRFGENGGIKSIADFTQNTGEVEELFRWLCVHNEYGNKSWASLPPEDHTIPKGASVLFNFEEDDHRAIIEATRHYTYVFITMHNPTPTSYSNIVKQLSSENETLVREKEELRKQLDKTNKQKKQYKLVIVLALALFSGALIAILIISDKNGEIRSQLATIQDNEKTISSQRDTLSIQKNTINEQIQIISSLNTKVKELESKYDSLESTYSNITSTYPLKITSVEIGNVYNDGRIETNYNNTIYSSRTMFLKPRIHYVGYSSGSYNFKVKWYTPSGVISRGNGSPSGYSQSQDVYIYLGENEATLNGWGKGMKGNWSSGTYRIEIWHNNICLKSKTFTVY